MVGFTMCIKFFAAAECQIGHRGTSYKGTKSTTVSGLTCQPWISQTRHFHHIFPVNEDVFGEDKTINMSMRLFDYTALRSSRLKQKLHQIFSKHLLGTFRLKFISKLNPFHWFGKSERNRLQIIKKPGTIFFLKCS